MNVIITGASSGIGYATLKELLRTGSFIIAIVRNQEKASLLREKVKSLKQNAHLEILTADLSSQHQVKCVCDQIRTILSSEINFQYDDFLPAFSETITQEANDIGKIDVMIHCAATVSSWYVNTEDGFELQFAVNHLAIHLMTLELMPLMQRSDDARVIVVSSGSHYRTKIDWDDIMMRRGYSCLRAYKRSKLCNMLFIKELADRYAGTIRAYAIDPGLVDTQIGLKGTDGIEAWVWKKRMKKGRSAEIPAKEIIMVATSDYYRGLSGHYIKKGESKVPSRYSRKTDSSKRLWELSDELCNLKEKRLHL